jgi:hypothetical protein
MNAYNALRVYAGAVILRLQSPYTPEEVVEGKRRMADFQAQSVLETIDLFEQSRHALNIAPASRPAITMADYKHLRPLDVGVIDKRANLSTNGAGMVVIELFSGLMATTEAMLRQGITIGKVYGCELDAKTRQMSEKRLHTLHQVFPDQLSEDAIQGCHSALPQIVKDITGEHLASLEKPDLVVAGFPCQGFSRASGHALGLRDSRTKLFEEAIRVVHLVNNIWPGHECAYIFENVDASDHPHDDVRYEFNNVVKRVLGPGFAFDAVAVGSFAHRVRRWWTNLAPGPLIIAMVERKYQRRNPDQYAQRVLEPGRQAQNAHHARAPGKHYVNVPGEPLRAFATFVTVKGSYAYRAGQQSLVQTNTGIHEEPTALERERATGFMDNTTRVGPAILEADRRRILGGTMDMHALTFLIGSILCFQGAFFTD